MTFTREEITLLGILAASATAFGVDFLRRWSERRATKRSVAGALLGEIAGFRFVIDSRRYVELAARLVEENRQRAAGERAVFPIVSARRPPREVFDAVIGQIGFLPSDVTRDLGRHYLVLNAILEDLADARERNAAKPREFDEEQEQQIARVVEEMAGLLTDLLVTQDRLLPRLRALAK